MSYDWWDDFTGAPNLQRILRNETVNLDDSGPVAVARVIGASVGVDNAGIFACVNVELATGEEVSLFADGTVHDGDDDTIGSHSLRLKASA